jgi:hypothetical protein
MPTPANAAQFSITPSLRMTIAQASPRTCSQVWHPAAAFPIGYTLVQYTATDAAGNTATCNFDVQVGDNQAPVITCPASLSVSNGVGVCGANVSFSVTATDNCGVPTVTTSANSGDFFPIGTTTVTATACGCEQFAGDLFLHNYRE